MDDPISLLKEYVIRNSEVKCIQFNPQIPPTLPINPYADSYVERKVNSHYFLLVASLDESLVISRAENARRLIVHLYKNFGEQLFQIVDPKQLHPIITEYKFYPEFGPFKFKITDILVSVNKFVKEKASNDLIRYSQRFESPKDFAIEIGNNILRMGGPIQVKTWIFLRWMVRESPDLRIFDHFSPRDLFIPLSSDIARVGICLGLVDSISNQTWKTWKDVKSFTQFAKELFPQDPVKVDFPFFLLGRWLKGRELIIDVLLDTLKRFEKFYNKTGFSILVTKEAKGYSAECPSLPGCITQGEDEDELLENMEDAIVSYLEVLKKYKIEMK